MTQIVYGKDLKSKFNSTKLKQGEVKEPFDFWDVDKFKVNGERFYLYVEKVTGLPVLTKTLDSQEFIDAFKMVVHQFGFVTERQAEWLTYDVRDQLNYVYSPNEPKVMFPRYTAVVKENKAELQSLLNDPILKGSSLRFSFLSLFLAEHINSALGMPLLMRINDVIQYIYGIEASEPQPSVKYHTIQAKFKSPYQWRSYEYESPSEYKNLIPIIRRNNLKIIDQYLENDNLKYLSQHFKKSVLDKYMNDFLLSNDIRLVTTNLADANVYFFLMAMNDNQPELTFKILIDFYDFLSKTGTIRKSEAMNVKRFLKETYPKVINDEADSNDYGKAEHLAEFGRFLAEHGDIIEKVKNGEKVPEDLRQELLTILNLNNQSD